MSVPLTRLPIIITPKAPVPLTLTAAIVDGQVRAMSDADAARAGQLVETADKVLAGVINVDNIADAEQLLADVSDHARDTASRCLELRRPYNEVSEHMKKIAASFSEAGSGDLTAMAYCLTCSRPTTKTSGY